MNTLNIDQLDEKRQSYIKVITVCWTLWFGIFILKELIQTEMFIIDLFTAVTSAFSFILLVIYFIKYIRLKSVIKNSRFFEALSAELFIVIKSKAISHGFWMIIIITTAFLILSNYYKYKVKLVCEIIIYIGVLTSLISGMIQNEQANDNQTL